MRRITEGETIRASRRNIAADQGLQGYALLDQCLLQLERLDFLGEKRGVEIDIASLVEITCGIGLVGNVCRIT